MNPEFERNVWLELTPVRLIVMTAVLALAFFAAALSNGTIPPGHVARVLFLALVVLWGTHNAARSVVGEIRERTWDGQRLSSLGPATMMWGKLFGPTVFNWVGGAICLFVIAADSADLRGAGAGFADVVYYVAMGVIAQASSLAASLIGIRRRQGRSQFEVFLYQVVGLIAAGIVSVIADPMGPMFGSLAQVAIVWWGASFPIPAFLLVSLAMFAGWALMACYRLMRLELKLVNGPLVWLVFLAFMIGYIAGFDAWGFVSFDVTVHRLILGSLTASALVYLSVILEPKDPVRLRWIGRELGKFHIGAAFARLPGWVLAWLATVVIGGNLIAAIGLRGMAFDQATAVAALGFVTRDAAIVVLMNLLTRRGGDFLAVAILILAYALLPSIFEGLHYGSGRILFCPHPVDPLWLSPAVAWCEAILLWVAAVARLSLSDKHSQN